MPKDRIIKMRVSDETHDEIARAAATADLSVSAYVRSVALKAARADNKYEAA